MKNRNNNKYRIIQHQYQPYNDYGIVVENVELKDVVKVNISVSFINKIPSSSK